jgi:hypothetical protein
MPSCVGGLPLVQPSESLRSAAGKRCSQYSTLNNLPVFADDLRAVLTFVSSLSRSNLTALHDAEWCSRSQESDIIFFNAALLHRSIGLKTRDYFAIAKPLIESIAE